LGQKDTPNTVKTFFFYFYFFRERWFLGQKAIQFQRRTVFRAIGLAPPCPKIVDSHIFFILAINIGTTYYNFFKMDSKNP